MRPSTMATGADLSSSADRSKTNGHYGYYLSICHFQVIRNLALHPEATQVRARLARNLFPSC